jgi:hypothetical protein
MKTSYCSLCLLLTSGLVVWCAPWLSLAQDPGTQTPSPRPGASSTSSTASSSPDAAAKAADRKRRFEEEKKRLESAGPRPQASSAIQGDNCHASPDDLMLSPNLVNMLVGETQRFSLFDVAGHKLTSQADWSSSDSSTADLAVEGGVPVLTSKRTGSMRVTARAGGRSVEATINVIAPEDMKPGTIRWSSPSPPCTKPIRVVPAVPH